ncbi:type II toxin-antitoxin system prevent-host-death family antitoxin [Methylobacterium sp. E-065]|nr:type II toxin-antitoxin system prevent-host-death family antitoxin [Methylobacterium sp. E-065]
MRRVQSDGPQHVTVGDQEAVVVISAEEFRRLTGTASGQKLIDALQASPYRDVDLAPEPVTMSVHDADL